ncbi:flagellar FliL protein [Methylobacterium sp. PvP062]|jgi:flagellar FliL protein|uniref:Flagellar protein FliL n=2 Tax=Methylobacterium radiotolerans TaxID=31998 RepID=B1LYK4_METRJ|nr:MULTISPECIES: flagellar basal body-associated protein FliL [Methylobacterium]MBE7203218.1 flagellar basal body-associated protein FliL [Parafilimonas terrae]MCX7332440.1 flagellar basal body-associated protein FliL [Hyphomicrobiales bacterium]GAN50188.1 flagellar basal body-associated protein FliL [Methylobacterium sp. ME121]ACB22831.1 cyclic nucleotide-binding protein [Methylobacterium radiotolerans JCM 2831]KIU36773.1 flagellar basal body-associated protein FliL [Methylobacterium radiotol
MAKKPKKASAEEGETGAEGAPKGKKKLMIMVAVAVLVVGGAGAGAFVMMGRGDSKQAAQGGDHGGGHGGGDAKGAGPEGKKPVVFVDVREMLLNLSPELPQDKGRFAKVRISLELKDAKVEEEVRPLMPRVEDALQVYMRELRASDITNSVGLFRLREELLRRVNIALYPAKVDAVLFKDVIVQ